MKIASNKIKDIVKFFREELKEEYENGELETIIAYCFEDFLKLNRMQVSAQGEQTVSESELLKFNFAVKDLKRHKPLQYILGYADFYGMKFKVDENVLIPRPETEELVQLIINDNQLPNPTILDIGTGSGCIPIALKKNIPGASVNAVDISAPALELAKNNAALNQVDVNFILGDILEYQSLIKNHSSLIDIVVSNPPYISILEKEKMDPNVVSYEPHLALFVDDKDPLIFYRNIASFALKMLKPGGKIYFEINQSLPFETKDLIENKGFKNVELIKDLSNNYRILRGNI